MEDPPSRPTPAPPRALDILLLPIFTGVVSACAVGAALWPRVGVAAREPATIAAVVGAISAGIVGIPAAYWAWTSGRLKIHQWMALGAVAGALPIAIPMVGHVLGSVLRGETAVLRQTSTGLLEMLLASAGVLDVARRLPLIALDAVPISIGTMSGLLYWCLVVRRRTR